MVGRSSADLHAPATLHSKAHTCKLAGMAILGPGRIDRRTMRSHPRPCLAVQEGDGKRPHARPPTSCSRPQDQRELLSSSSAPGENTTTRKRVFNQMLIELKNNKLKASGVDTGAQSRLQKVMRKLASDSKAPALKVCKSPPSLGVACCS